MKRKLVSASFTTLIFPMHAAMSALVIFIVEILVIFSTMLTKMYSTLDLGSSSDISGGIAGGSISAQSLGFSLFQNVPTGLLIEFSWGIVIVLTIANTFAAKYVDGGHNNKLCYYGSIMCVLSGICLMVVPPIVEMIFSFPLFSTT